MKESTRSRKGAKRNLLDSLAYSFTPLHLCVSLLLLSLGTTSAAPQATFVKGSDGSAAHQYKNPCKVTVSADPAFTADREFYVQSRPYVFRVTARPATGWKAVRAEYTAPGGTTVVIPLNGSITPISFEVSLDLSSKTGSTHLFRVLFATQRLHPDGTRPEYQEFVHIRGNAYSEAVFWTLDIDGNGLGDAGKPSTSERSATTQTPIQTATGSPIARNFKTEQTPRFSTSLSHRGWTPARIAPPPPPPSQ